MSVIRQQNWLSAARVDVAHLRSVESSICNDFDLLAGTIIAGKHPLVVSGFYLITTGVTQPQSLQLQVAGSVLMHFNASESGSMFRVQSGRANETLTTTNTRVDGGWTPSQVNYVGIDLIRSADASTVDLVQFIDTTSLVENPRSVPLARTLDYRIVISTTDFASNPNIAPLAKVTLDPSGNIIALEDARNIFGRLGSGGSVPNVQNAFPWPAGRAENLSGDLFLGGDKAVSSLKDWMDAAMTRIWELGGGQQWYSPTADRNVKIVRTGATFTSSGEHFEWDGTNLHWQGLVAVFDNSTATSNTITDQTTDLTGLTNLADGECLYVDFVRTAGSTLTAVKGLLGTLGTPTVPGSRWVFAWRYGANIYTRDHGWAVGSSFKLATVTVAGTSRLSATNTGSATPRVATCEETTGLAIATGLTRGDVGTSLSNDFFKGAGDLAIGGKDQDHNVLATCVDPAHSFRITGFQRTLSSTRATLEVLNSDSNVGNPDNQVARFIGYNEGTFAFEYANTFDANGAIGFRNISSTPVVRAAGGADTIAAKLYFKSGDASFPQPTVKFADGNEHPVAMNGGNSRVRWEANALNTAPTLVGSYFTDFTGEVPTGAIVISTSATGAYSNVLRGGVYLLSTIANAASAITWQPSPDGTSIPNQVGAPRSEPWDFSFRAKIQQALSGAFSVFLGLQGAGDDGLSFTAAGLSFVNAASASALSSWVPDTNMHVFRASFNGTTIRVYVDNVLVLTNTSLVAAMGTSPAALIASLSNIGASVHNLYLDKAFVAFSNP